MQDKSPNKTKRVSFAAECQVNYIYQDEYNSTKTSSSTAEAPIEFTTEIPEFRNMSLFQPVDEAFLGENIDNLFLEAERARDPLDDFSRRMSISRKQSIDPLRDVSAARSEYGIGVAGSASTGQRSTPTHRLSVEMDDSTAAAIRAQNIRGDIRRPLPAEDIQDAIFNENRENVENGGALGKSQDASFNDTAISNSSYAVEELVNTVDLKNMVAYDKREKPELNAFLASIGIRFLDDSIGSATRRDTLSKSHNEVDPALEYYYRYSVKPKIDYLNTFSNFLSQRLSEMLPEIAKIQADIDTAPLNKDLLKKIRNESRNKSKIDWYLLRKANEMQFNRQVLSNKNRLQEILIGKKREHERLEGLISEKIQETEALKRGNAALHTQLSSANPAEFNEASKLQHMVVESRALLASLRVDVECARKKAEESMLEESVLSKSIARLKTTNENLKKNIMVKGTTEVGLEEVKKRFLRICNFYRLKIVKISTYSMVVAIFGHNLSIDLDGELNATGCSISSPEYDPFIELLDLSSFQYPLSLSCFSRRLFSRFVLLESLKTEFLQLRGSCKGECFWVEPFLHIRFSESRLGKRTVDLTVDLNLNLIRRGTVLQNAGQKLGILSEVVLNEISESNNE